MKDAPPFPKFQLNKNVLTVNLSENLWNLIATMKAELI